MSPSRYPCAVTFIWRDLLITVSDTQFFLSPNIEVISRSMENKLWKGLSFKFDTIISIHTKNLIVTVDGDFLNLQGLKFWEWEDSFEGIFCHGSSSFCLYFLQKKQFPSNRLLYCQDLNFEEGFKALPLKISSYKLSKILPLRAFGRYGYNEWPQIKMNILIFIHFYFRALPFLPKLSD